MLADLANEKAIAAVAPVLMELGAIGCPAVRTFDGSGLYDESGHV
jgi:hypothetical protein